MLWGGIYFPCVLSHSGIALTTKVMAGFWRRVSRYEIMLSTRPEKSVGTDAIWDLATEGLKGALKRKGWDYTVRADAPYVAKRWCFVAPPPLPRGTARLRQAGV